MRNFFKNIDRRFYIFTAIWALVQLVLICVFFNFPMGNDALGYERHAIQNFELGTFYPSQANLYDIYIQSPGLVNALIPFYAVFGTVRAFMFLSWLMNIGILFEILFVGFKLFNKRIGYIAAITYALILSNIFAATLVSTEVLYLFLALTGFCLSLSSRKMPQLFAGLFYVAAWTVRPLVLAFVIASLLYHICCRKAWLSKAIINVVALSVPLIILAIVNQRRVCSPVISSSTGGCALLQVAYPGAKLTPNMGIFYDKDGFARKDVLDHTTFYEKDRKWKHEAIIMIKEHPFKYIALCAARPVIMWNKDTWCVPNFMPDHIDDTNYAIQHHSKKRFILCQAIRMCYSLVYYVVCVLFVISIIRFRRLIFTLKGIPLVILLLGVCGTCLFGMEHRYHYPYIWIICLWAAMEIDRILVKRSKKNIG